MTLRWSAARAAVLARSIERADFFRRGEPSPAAPLHREWFHFSLASAELTLLVNVSIVDDQRPAAARRGERHRVLVLARDEAGWEGNSEPTTREESAVAGGQIAAVLGSHSLAFEHGRFRVAGRLRSRPVAYDLELEPRAQPLLANNFSLGSGHAPINWCAVPRLIANGWVSVGERRHDVRDALAYHDHNWGHFSYRSLAWQWGHALPDASSNPFCFVFARLLNRARGVCFLQAVSIWRDGIPLRIFRDAELRVTSEGELVSDGPTIPRGAALLAEGTRADLPRRLTFHAQRDTDQLRGTFEPLDTACMARIVVPHEEDLGTTLIHEVLGTLKVHGNIAGEPVVFAGHGMFEFLGAGR